MLVYNQDKTEILEEYDLSIGRLEADTLVVHYDATPGIEGQEEIGHYEVIAEYPNGGQDLAWIIDSPRIKAVLPTLAHDENVAIQVYIPLTQEEIDQNNRLVRLEELKRELAETDMYALAYLEGSLSEEDYTTYKEERIQLRQEIEELNIAIGEYELNKMNNNDVEQS